MWMVNRVPVVWGAPFGLNSAVYTASPAWNRTLRDGLGSRNMERYLYNPGWMGNGGHFGIRRQGELWRGFPVPMAVNPHTCNGTRVFTFPEYSKVWSYYHFQTGNVYLGDYVAAPWDSAVSGMSGNRDSQCPAVYDRIDDHRVIYCRAADYVPPMFEIFDFDGVRSKMYAPWLSAPSGTRNTALVYLACDDLYLAFAFKDSTEGGIYKLLLASKENPEIFSPPTAANGWLWLDEALRSMTRDRYAATGKLVRIPSFMPEDPSLRRRYLNLSVMNASTDGYDNGDHLLRVDLQEKTYRKIPAPGWTKSMGIACDRRGRLHYVAGAAYYMIEAGAVSGSDKVTILPVNCWRGYPYFSSVVSIMPCAPYKFLCCLKLNRNNADDSNVFLVDAASDAMEPIPDPLRRSGDYQADRRLLLDDSGGIWMVDSRYRDTGLARHPVAAISNYVFTEYRWNYLGEFLETGVVPPESGASLGKDGRAWNSLSSGMLVGDRSVVTLGSENYPFPVRAQSIPGPYPLRPWDAADAPDDSVPRAVNGHWTWTTDLNFAQVPPEGGEGEALGVSGGIWSPVPGPAPLPDWFDGCTPVVDGGVWRAGDALAELPFFPQRSNVVFVSRGKRWDNAVLSFTNTMDTLELAFPSITSASDYWPIFANGCYENAANDGAPRVDGYSPGVCTPLPDPELRSVGVETEDWGITGNYSNFNYINKSGDPTNDTNPPLSVFGPVRSTGSGRWLPGDLVETLRDRLDEWDSGWHKLIGTTTVNRIQDFEPGTLYGPDHEELFHILGRHMSRLWMDGPLEQGVPAVFEVQISTDPSFAAGVVEKSTATSVDGWWFRHTDGGSTAFIPAGPAVTTVVGVLFDPRTAGVPYRLDEHHGRWRSTIGGVVGEWQPVRTVDLDDMWWNIYHVEDQTYVNHFVRPDLLDKGLWLRTKEPDWSHGGAPVYLPELNVASGSVVDIEIEFSEGISFIRKQERSTADGKLGWSVLSGDRVRSPYPSDSTFGPEMSGWVTVVFDPREAFLRARCGTRFYRWRAVVDGAAGSWTTGHAVVTESTMARTDMASVLGMEIDLRPGESIPVPRLSATAAVVHDGGVEPAGPVDPEWHSVPAGPANPQAAAVIGHGAYVNAPENRAHVSAIRALVPRRHRDAPPMHDSDVRVSARLSSDIVNEGDGEPDKYGRRTTRPYTSEYALDNTSYKVMAGENRFPGSGLVHVWRRTLLANRVGVPDAYTNAAYLPTVSPFRFFTTPAADAAGRYEVGRGMWLDKLLIRWQWTPLGEFFQSEVVPPMYGSSSAYVTENDVFALNNRYLEQFRTLLDPRSGAFAEAWRLEAPETFSPRPQRHSREFAGIHPRGVNQGMFAIQIVRDYTLATAQPGNYTRFCALGESGPPSYSGNENTPADSDWRGVFSPYPSGGFWGDGLAYGTANVHRVHARGFASFGSLIAESGYYGYFAVVDVRGLMRSYFPWTGAIANNPYNSKASFLAAPGLALVQIPLNIPSRDAFGTCWLDPADGGVGVFNYARQVRNSGNAPVTFHGLPCGLVYPRDTAAWSASAVYGGFELGDASPMLSFDGDKFIRLPAGQEIGR